MATKKSNRRGTGKREERSTSGKPMQTKTPRYAKTQRTGAAASPKAAKTDASKPASSKPASSKPTAAKPTTSKPTASRAPRAPTTPKPPKTSAPRLVGSAGRRILSDLGLTNEELHACLPADAPQWLRDVFWCQLDLGPPLEAIAAHFEGRYDTSIEDALRFPPEGPAEGLSVRTLVVRPKGLYCTYSFYAMRGEVYGGEGSYQLEVSFREAGTQWGSNRAVYERFKAIELAPLGAQNVRELTE